MREHACIRAAAPPFHGAVVTEGWTTGRLRRALDNNSVDARERLDGQVLSPLNLYVYIYIYICYCFVFQQLDVIACLVSVLET